jgi:ATP-dependent DNA helicase RecG
MINKDEVNILDNSVQFLKSIGPKRAQSFAKFGIKTISDIMFYFPTRHLDRRTTITSGKAYTYLLDGFEGEITILASVVSKEIIKYSRRELLKVQFRDAAGFFECVWFQGINYFYDVFNAGNIFALSGKPALTKYGNVQLVHPDYDRISDDESRGFLNTGKIIPFYKIPKELRETNIGDLSIRRIIASAVQQYADYLSETLPVDLVHKHNLLNIVDSVKAMHFPDTKELFDRAVYRFKFEELFYIEMLVALRKHNYKTKLIGNSLKVKTKLIGEFLKILPFELTKAQLRVLAELRKDMEDEKPMNRLLQGDVGSGKTIVALIAMLIAVDNGCQAVLMAPTEILADQHAKNISAMMNMLNENHPEFNIKTSLLIGGQKKSDKNKNLSAIELQETDIIIGTHALFEEKVGFKNLGLVIVDEQHRFGVEQRAKLFAKGKTPDILVMSATPIPRTLSMTVYGDLDVSIIDEMPKNRISIKTILRGEEKLPDIYKFIVDKNKKRGCQSFIVYPLVEESEKLELKAAETYFKELQNTYLKQLRLGLLHGRMTWREKEEVMLNFLENKFDVLIATTVIEVGIDIPNANVILINDAHRFGLSQLHQLRGRVGRGTQQAYCILVTKDEYAAAAIKYKNNLEYLSPAQIEKYKSSVRLQTMVQYLDGFKVAEIDLKLRGPGNIFGTEQSGFPELKHADIATDTKILIAAKEEAFNIIQQDPHLKDEKHSSLRINLIKNYSKSLKYAKIA